MTFRSSCCWPLLLGLLWAGAMPTPCAAAAPRADQLFKLTASHPSLYAGFADSVAVGDHTVLVGASFDGHEILTRGGSVYMYDAATGAQTGKLTPSDTMRNDTFGVSAAIDGNLALVGASGSVGATGSAYLFDLASGQELRKLTASNGRFGDIFGYSVDIDGQTAIVGAPRNSPVVNGKAYLYDVTTGQERFVLEAPPLPLTLANSFGQSVALSANWAIVGAPYYRDLDHLSGAGAAYVFDVTTGQELFRLTASDGGADDWFGGSVAVCGNVAIVAAPGALHEGVVTGAAYLFDIATGQQIAKLVANDATSLAGFGNSVSINHNFALIGANGDASDTGAAYLFDLTTHEQVLKFTAADAAPGHNFALPVALTDARAVLGAYGADDFNGAAYVFSVPEPATLALACAGLLAALAARGRGRRQQNSRCRCAISP